jgi:hypothetical protein
LGSCKSFQLALEGRKQLFMVPFKEMLIEHFAAQGLLELERNKWVAPTTNILSNFIFELIFFFRWQIDSVF